MQTLKLVENYPIGLSYVIELLLLCHAVQAGGGCVYPKFLINFAVDRLRIWGGVRWTKKDREPLL